MKRIIAVFALIVASCTPAQNQSAVQTAQTVAQLAESSAQIAATSAQLSALLRDLNVAGATAVQRNVAGESPCSR